nr:MAG TPA_asm: hypothetical protein [Caudoviricetes sp.]
MPTKIENPDLIKNRELNPLSGRTQPKRALTGIDTAIKSDPSS